MASKRPARDAHFLAILAEPLHCARNPFYLQASPTGHPDGWYAVLTDGAAPRYLGRNVQFAERKLIELRDDRQPAA